LGLIQVKMGKIGIAIQIINGQGKAPVKIKGGTQMDFIVLNRLLDKLKKYTSEELDKLEGGIKHG